MTATLQPSAATGSAHQIVYPIADRKPMAETNKHRRLMMYVIDALTIFDADRPDVYVPGNNVVFYEEGNPKAPISPDGCVAFGVPPGPRDSYMDWQEGVLLPDVVFEFTSRKIQREDTASKLPLYERVLQVPEYFLFDPTGDYLRPRLQGYRLVGNQLELVAGRLHSEKLSLDLVQAGEDLRLYDTRRRAETEAEACRAAEDEVTRLRAELEAMKKQGPSAQNT